MEENKEINKFPAKIETVEIAAVFPNAWNPNVQTDKIFRTLVNSVKIDGFNDPVLVRELPDGLYEIIDGEHKWQAAKELGYTEILVANVGKVSDIQAKRMTITANLHGAHDILKEAEILKELKDSGNQSLFPLIPKEEKEIEEQIKLLEFNFDQYKTDLNDVDKTNAQKAAESALTLEKILRKVHAESEDTKLRLFIEQFFEWKNTFISML